MPMRTKLDPSKQKLNLSEKGLKVSSKLNSSENRSRASLSMNTPTPANNLTSNSRLSQEDKQ